MRGKKGTIRSRFLRTVLRGAAPRAGPVIINYKQTPRPVYLYDGGGQVMRYRAPSPPPASPPPLTATPC